MKEANKNPRNLEFLSSTKLGDYGLILVPWSQYYIGYSTVMKGNRSKYIRIRTRTFTPPRTHTQNHNHNHNPVGWL